MNTVGVFLARFQPLHNGHLFMIEKALIENEKVLIVLGSANKQGMIRNPFSLSIRSNWLKDSLINKEDFNRIKIIELADWSTESDKEELKEWGHYLYYNIVSAIKQKTFNIYYNDDLDVIQSWFDNEVNKYITIEHSERSNIFDGLSATKIRQAIIDEDMNYLNKFLPEAILEDIELLNEYLIKVNNNPKNDFSMN
jgi:cytidyltransferase-like protein